MAEPPASATAESASGLTCPECGYDLRAIASDRCPECGLVIDRAAMSVSRIPWAHRRTIGRFKAYWRTNLMVIFWPKRLADEAARPVGLADAQRFRWVTVGLAWLPIVLSAVAIVVFDWDEVIGGWRVPDSRLGWCLEATAYVALVFALGLALLMVSGVGSYFFHLPALRIVQQNRAIALSYYTCAPLAWLWAPAAFFAISFVISEQDWSQRGFGANLHLATGLVASGFVVAIVVLCWLRIGKLLRRTTHCGPGRGFVFTLYLPIAWAICLFGALLIPASVLFISLIILSFGR